MPEITIHDEFGRAIATTVLSFGFRTAIEIGSWDGSGSTSILAGTLGRNKPSRLVAIESEPSRHARLSSRFANERWITCHHGSSISSRSLTPRCFEDVWKSPHNKLRYQEEQVASWWREFEEYMATTTEGYLEANPGESYDVAMIDGSEFTGWDEYRLLRDRVRCFMLDDSFHAYKCVAARVELQNDPQWSLVWASSFVRNGAAIFVKK